ncbi:MAG: SUMF1/EgtB/PvdO family nonheme iron enzyme [Deltaproteobacteria bacterium]|nr:SUMF1/EgtB/PvdO family nonheme iron enzyme [Deltaproteobacteria bacterium]
MRRTSRARALRSALVVAVAACAEPAPQSTPSTADSAAVAASPSASASASPLAGVDAPALGTGQSSATPARLPATSATTASAGPASEPGAPCPPEMALLRRTCIDRHEAHLVVVPSDGSTAKPHPHHQRPPEGVRYEARSAAAVFPQGYISRKESELACKNAGKRLCSYDEWRFACRGKRAWIHPYANRERRGACNSAKEHLLQRLFGRDARLWKYEEHFNSPRLNQEPGFLERTGTFAECVSESGVHDLVGNLHEWVSGRVTPEFVEGLEKEPVERRKQPWREGNAIFVGGFYSTSSEHGPGCFNVTIAHEPRYHDYSTGFRCCKAASLPPPEPKRKPKRR